MKEKYRGRKMRRFLGIILTAVGFFALITPFTPGSWLMLVGLGILLDKSPQEVLKMSKERFPIIGSIFKE